MLHRRGYRLVRVPEEGTLGRDLTRVMDQRKISTLIDVGAHEGRYGSLWRSLGFDGRIVSFEPAPGPFGRLSSRAGSDPRWEAHRLAVGDREEMAEFHEFDLHEEFAPLHRPSGRPGLPPIKVSRSYEVPVRTLDGLVHEHAVNVEGAFLKIDTQGHDLAVLNGGADALKAVAAVQVEVPFFGLYDGAPGGEELIAHVRGLGFDLVGLYPVHDHPRRLVPIEFDGLFVRTGEDPE